MGAAVNLTLDREEYEAAAKVWRFLEDSGHLDCGGWTQDLADPGGTVTCSCGSRFVPFGEVWLSKCCAEPALAEGQVSQFFRCTRCENPCDAVPAVTE